MLIFTQVCGERPGAGFTDRSEMAFPLQLLAGCRYGRLLPRSGFSRIDGDGSEKVQVGSKRSGTNWDFSFECE